jgi:hypothetical protein
MALTPTRQIGPKKPVVLTEQQFQEIEKAYTSLQKYSKEELKEKAYFDSRVTFSFDEHIDKASLVAHIMSRRYGDQLTAWGIERDRRKEVEKKAKRAARRKDKKRVQGKGPDCETCQYFQDCVIVENEKKRVKCTDYFPSGHQIPIRR